MLNISQHETAACSGYITAVAQEKKSEASAILCRNFSQGSAAEESRHESNEVIMMVLA